MNNFINNKIKWLLDNKSKIEFNMEDITLSGFNFKDIDSLLDIEYINDYIHEYNSQANHYIFCNRAINFGRDGHIFSQIYRRFGLKDVTDDIIEILTFNRMNKYLSKKEK